MKKKFFMYFFLIFLTIVFCAVHLYKKFIQTKNLSENIVKIDKNTIITRKTNSDKQNKEPKNTIGTNSSSAALGPQKSSGRKKDPKKEEFVPVVQEVVSPQTNMNKNNVINLERGEKEDLKDQKRMIRIKNAISEDMTAYKYWNINYKPSSFKITVNNQELSPDQEQTIAITNNKIVVKYEYEFMKGYRKGNQDIEVTIPPEEEQFNLEFSWYKEPRVSLKKI